MTDRHVETLGTAADKPQAQDVSSAKRPWQAPRLTRLDGRGALTGLTPNNENVNLTTAS